ncbi:FHA domain-containing protein [Salisaeta longa]|uniref:FHA domain-containing protein n=1 Tax=Salisaeta longa TaxID=503170 RepID=UPI0003B6625A|nr:FHA domain-containing protein [Salisaeta longa]
MPIKLQVTREGEDASEAADYLFEQDRITIGRGSGNDLTLPDQKISKRHAQIEQTGGEYKLSDQGSKNHTYLHGERLQPHAPVTLQSGDVFSLGEFRVEFVPLFMPSSEQTALAGSDSMGGNAFSKPAARLATALEEMADAYQYMTEQERDAQLEQALQQALQGAPAASRVAHQVADALQPSTPKADGDSASVPARVRPVLNTLLEAVARMISIPPHFWREFSGHTVMQPPEMAFLRKADLESLQMHLLDPKLSDEEQTERLDDLRASVNTLVAHQIAMLSGYKQSVESGGKKVLEQVQPTDRTSDGVFGKWFAEDNDKQTAASANRWKKLYNGDWSAIEKKWFRPAFMSAYLDRMADAWNISKEELVEDPDALPDD